LTFTTTAAGPQRICIDVAHELILRHTNVHTVKMELDTYYGIKSGADVLTYFARVPGRFPLLHLKDLDHAGEITDLGRGTIDLTTVLHAATRAGVQHMFVEHDRARDPLASARSSFEDVRAP
jgi:sugar phosphate isomerase/epimerase